MPADIEIVDVERGCGHLVPGGYYLSSADCFSSSGGFHAVTYPFGNGFNQLIDCSIVKPRNMMTVNPAASFVIGGITKPDMTPKSWSYQDGALYSGLAGRIGRLLGLVDHVGSNYYPTPSQFTEELFEHGPNRHLPGAVVKQIAKMLPLPVIFTHRMVPVFKSAEQIARLMACCEAKMDSFRADERHYGPNWLREKWGALRSYDRGGDHFMIPAMQLLDTYASRRHNLDPDDLVWQEVGRIADDIYYEEQPFAISWFLRAIKIVDEKHPIDEADRRAGIIAAHPTKPEEITDEQTNQ